ncbi:MAG TPA: exonuclease domain-containing protein [Candidatus Deferrimicrobium sp.]|nr:exonuclease domain-containing protein [Candidatus Deferrimicrobium sp.]
MLNALFNLGKNKIKPSENSESLTSLYDRVLALKACKRENHALDSGCFVVFDTETTGLMAHRGDEIISLGGVAIIDNQLTDRKFCKLVNPYRNIPELITLLTGITETMTGSAEDLVSVLTQFLEFVGSSTLVAHNAQFDLCFINLKLRKYFGQSLSIPILDTYLIAQLLHPHRKSYCLDDLAKFYQIPLVARHTSLGDSIIAGKLFIKMVEELKSRGIKNSAELFSYLKFQRLI